MEGALRGGIDADPFFISSNPLELHDAGNLGEECIIASDSNIQTGMDAGSPLPDQDIAGQNLLAPEPLDPQTLGMAVSAVSGGADSFFMCHFLTP